MSALDAGILHHRWDLEDWPKTAYTKLASGPLYKATKRIFSGEDALPLGLAQSIP